MNQALSIAALDRCHLRLLGACDALEALADALPGPVPVDPCIDLARCIVALVAETQLVEEQVLYPLLASSTGPGLALMGERLRRDHEIDGQTALEVEDALMGLADKKRSFSAEATGYLLRCCFECLRRRVRAEQFILSVITSRASAALPIN